MRQNVRQPVARVDRSFPWYIGSSLVVAIGGGFALALLLPLAEAAGWKWGARWPALVQAHGHLQVAGWVGLFVLGMAFRLIPRFAGRPLRFARLTPFVLGLLLLGLVGRAVAQPSLGVPGAHAVLMLAAASEVAGAALVALIFFSTLIPVAARFAVASLFLLGALGLLAQSVFGWIWLFGLTPEIPIITPDQDGVLLELQFYCFLLPIVIGVSLRTMPAFFKGRAPRAMDVWLLAALLAAGSVLYSAPLVIGDGGLAVREVGETLLALAIVGAFLETGIWRHPDGLRPSARHVAVLIRTAYIWMLFAGALLGCSAIYGLVRGGPIAAYIGDATRHLLALGLFSTLIAGMAQLVLPALAQRRLKPRPAKFQTWALWSLFTGAAALRTAGALVEGFGMGSDRYWIIAVSGLLGIAGVLFLAVTMLRAAIQGPPEIVLQPVATR